ncbi:uncharacterized protein BN523_01826 [Bacteroides sp. CAG:189]|nr:uncharacterized protein BN523_01826 [Bacteroides sp. CAG:189]
MNLIINFVILIILCVTSLQIYTRNFNAKRLVTHPLAKRYKYRLNRNMYLLIFIVCTAPFFLGSFSLAKYGFYFIFLLYLIINNKISIKIDIIVTCYLLFYIWLLISLSYSTSIYNGIMLLIKYIFPLLFLWLGYSSIKDKYTLYYFLKSVNKSAMIYALLIGGVSAIFMPWIYYSTFGDIFLKYAGLADYFTSIFIIPFILFWITQKKIYIMCALWLILSTILESVRTGLGGMFLVGLSFYFFKYKLKSLPYIALAISIFIGIIIFIPEVNQKMFGDKAGKINARDIIQKDALSLDNIQTSGRSHLWEINLTKFYEPHPLIGSGLGTTIDFMKKRAAKEHTIALLHNDYVQILCETGIIGIIFLVLFYLSIICKVFYYTWVIQSNTWIKISGIMAISSIIGIAFSMFFDNIVSHSMTSLINPFIFIGFFLKFIDLQKLNNHQ